MKKKVIFLFAGTALFSVIVASLSMEPKAVNNQKLNKIATAEQNDIREKEVTNRIREKREKIRKMALSIAHANNSVDDAPDMIVPDVLPPEPTGEELALRNKRKKVEHIFHEKGHEVLETTHANESRDGEWTSKIEGIASSMLRNDGFVGTSLSEVDCRETLCKIQFHHKSGEAFTSFVENEGTRHDEWVGRDFGRMKRLSEDENGPIETTILFGHDDAPLKKMLDELVAMVDLGQV